MHIKKSQRRLPNFCPEADDEDPFADIEEDKDELEENETVLDNCCIILRFLRLCVCVCVCVTEERCLWGGTRLVSVTFILTILCIVLVYDHKLIQSGSRMQLAEADAIRKQMQSESSS